jgi:PKD repeat protein
MYNPPETGTDTTEFIELYNNDTTTVNLSGFYFSDGVSFSFPPYDLSPHDYVVVSSSDSAVLYTYGIPSFQWTSGALSNAGELIRLKDYHGFTVDSVLYDDVHPWDSTADGGGPSLELCDPDADNSLEFAAVNIMNDTIWATPLAGCTDPPVAGFTADNTFIIGGNFVNFTDSSSGTIASWVWNFEGGIPSMYAGPEPPPILYNDYGEYDVSLTVKNVAGEDIELRNDYIHVGVDAAGNSLSGSGIRVFPNPANGKFTIAFRGIHLYDIDILSVLGYKIAGKSGVTGTCEFDFSDRPEGIYFLCFTDLSDNTVHTQKLVIHK